MLIPLSKMREGRNATASPKRGGIVCGVGWSIAGQVESRHVKGPTNALEKMGKRLLPPEVPGKGTQRCQGSARVRRPEVKKCISLAAASSPVGKLQATAILPFAGNVQLGQPCRTAAQPGVPVLCVALWFSLQTPTFFPLTLFQSPPSSPISSFQIALEDKLV